jgi:hypothetical protein
MDKDEALDLALEELENCADLLKVFEAPLDSCVGAAMLGAEKAITAIKQALAAPVQPVAQWQKRHPARTDGEWENTNEHDAKWWRDKAQGWEIRALYTTPPAQPAVPDALTSADIEEHIEYVAGWNDCRQAMMEMMK